jgi:hypothetical protein
VQNYFNYFTEIEEHFQRRRGSLLMLSTLDWALIESWREAEVPLAAVLRGIDSAFDKYDARKAKTNVRRVNGLAWCTQEVLQAAEDIKEAAVGASSTSSAGASTAAARGAGPAPGFEQERVANHLDMCGVLLREAQLENVAQQVATETATRLEELAGEVRGGSSDLEALERNLTVMEEKLFAALMTTTPEAELLAVRTQAAAELAPYRSKMKALQIRQIEEQFLRKRLLERCGLPRLSLFYMSQG